VSRYHRHRWLAGSWVDSRRRVVESWRMRWSFVPALVASSAACAARPTTRSVVHSTSKQDRASSSSACHVPSDCALVATDCCGDCGTPRRGHVRAVNAAWLAERGGLPACVGVGCPRCRRDPDPTLLATCRGARCAVVDLERSRLTRCRVDADCTLRASGCCECGSPALVALRSDSLAAYEHLVCESPQQACPECIGPRPGDLAAACTEGRCVARRAPRPRPASEADAGATDPPAP
jgi:hypothetical protein